MTASDLPEKSLISLNSSPGQEFDIVMGLEQWKHLELEFVAGLFFAGDVFASQSDQMASKVEFKVNYNF